MNGRNIVPIVISHGALAPGVVVVVIIIVLFLLGLGSHFYRITYTIIVGGLVPVGWDVYSRKECCKAPFLSSYFLAVGTPDGGGAERVRGLFQNDPV